METVKRIRTMRGMNQIDLAKASGVSQNTISEIETGRRYARPATLKKLAKALGVEIADLLEESALPKVPPPPDPQPSFNGELKEERRLQLLRAWRALVATLEHRWQEDPPQSAREITEVLDIMETLANENVIGKGRIVMPDEAIEISVIRKSLENLNDIADSIQKDQRRRKLLTVIQGARSA